jgi:uncharacterized membrane protein YphA (DoxX/SURF4 family)
MKDKIVKFLSSVPILYLCRFILGGLFIYASIDKIVHPEAFAKIIYNYRLFPAFSIHLLAVVLPWIEMITGLFLVAGFFKQTAAIMLSTLLVLFIAALSFNLLRGLDFNCGCFTTTSTSNGDPLGLIFRDVLLLIPGLIIIFFQRAGGTRSPKTASRQHPERVS